MSPKPDTKTIREPLTNPPNVGAVISDGVSERDLCDAMRAFDRAGCALRLIAPREGLIQAWGPRSLGHSFLVDATVENTDHASLDVLFIPGGDRAVETLQQDNAVLRFISDFTRTGKPVAAAPGAANLLAPEDRIPPSENDRLAVEGNVVVAFAPDSAEDAAVASLRLAADRAQKATAAA